MAKKKQVQQSNSGSEKCGKHRLDKPEKVALQVYGLFLIFVYEESREHKLYFENVTVFSQARAKQ